MYVFAEIIRDKTVSLLFNSNAIYLFLDHGQSALAVLVLGVVDEPGDHGPDEGLDLGVIGRVVEEHRYSGEA